MSSLIVEVCKIDKIEKHPNADRLRIATVKGWHCIIGLDDYNEGDLIVFCPPDCIIPKELIDKYKLEYLSRGSQRQVGRVKTVKLRGYISQGLVLPLPEGKKFKLGQDMSKIMDITKYEPPISSHLQRSGRQPTKRKRNPLFDAYTDIENIKNFPDVFKDGDIVVITEKIHGTNFRAGKLPRYKDNLWGKIKAKLFGSHEFVYGSHHVQITGHKGRKCFYGEDVYGQIAKKYNLAEIIPEDYIIYGEIYGKKIQKLEYGLNNIDMRIFDVKYKGKYLNYPDLERFSAKFNLPLIPLLYFGKFHKEFAEIHATGFTTLCDNHIKEGCVIKSYMEENHPRIGRKILKSINPEYLLKKNRTEYH